MLALLATVITAGLGVGLGLCPDPARHEGPRDCPWAAVARAAESGDATRVIAETAPTVWRDAARDRPAVALHDAWGTSRNFDEHERAVIVAPAIADALGDLLGVRPRDGGEVLHAGLQHTYGYLFSTLPTSFGYKRARWVDGELERGLGLPDGLLGPHPKSGTLYANVTCLLGALVFEEAAWQLLAPTCASSGAPEIVGLREHRKPHEAWLETAGKVALRTDLYPLAPQQSLLVYSAIVAGSQKLLTSFPVDEQTARSVRAQPTGKGVPIEARYNAVVPGLDKSTLGSRTLVNAK